MFRRCVCAPGAPPLRVVVAVGILILAAGTCLAEPAVEIVRVEEDWELVIDSPDPDSTAPQVVCVTSPLPGVDGLYLAFEINHQSLPDFTPGGLQLQVWSGETAVTQRKFPNAEVAATQQETVRWTQSMEVQGDNLVFDVIDGSSTTWGNFGGQGYLHVGVGSPVANLNGYDPTVSVNNSGIGYAANRVSSLVLKAVRYRISTGEVYEDLTQRVVK